MTFLHPINAVWFGQPVGIERPLGLLLALLLAGLAAYAVVQALGQRSATQGWVTPGSEARLVTAHWHQRRALRLALGGVGLALLALAWAGPTWGNEQQRTTHRGIDLVVALDASRSMLATDVAPNRLTAARAAVEQLLGKLGGDRVGIVAFARDAFVQAPLTTDYDAARLYLRAVDPLQMQQGGTALGAALRQAGGMFERAEQGQRDRAVLIVSDGEDWEGGAVEQARALGAGGVHVYTLGVGTRAGAPVPVIDGRGRLVGYEKDAQGSPVLTRPNPEALAAIAAAGHGEAFFDDGAVNVAPLARRIDGLKKGDLGAATTVVGINRYQSAALPGVLLLALALALKEERRQKTSRAGARSTAGAAAAALVLFSLAHASTARAAGMFDSPDPNVKAGLAAYSKADYARAAEAFAKAQRADPKPIASFDHGVALYKAGQPEQALKEFEHLPAAALEGRNAYNAGVAQAALKQKDQAIKSFRSALEVDPANEDARHNLEVMLEQQKQDQQQQDQQKQDQQKQDQQKQDQQQQDQQQQDQQQQDQQKQDQQKQDQQQQDQQQQDQQQQDQQKSDRTRAQPDEPTPMTPREQAEHELDQLKQGERLLPVGKPSTRPPVEERHDHTW